MPGTKPVDRAFNAMDEEQLWKEYLPGNPDLSCCVIQKDVGIHNGLNPNDAEIYG